MKQICYALFAGKCERYEKMAYIRGFYFNVRMNNLIFPDWRTHLEVDREIYSQYQGLFDWLVANSTLDLNINETTPELCRGMMWRVKPAFTNGVSHILCRDCDSLTSYREALAVQMWLESGKRVHGINDNRAHSGLMGGMVGFSCAFLKACMEVNSWEELIAGWDLSQRGSDQHLLNQKVYPRVKDDLLLVGGNLLANVLPDAYSATKLPGVDPRLWESNLCSAFIGSPGFNELETIRFLARFDNYNWKYQPIEQEFKNIFYWHL